MSREPKREWTQHDILAETRRLHTGAGFFQVLGEVCDEAYGDALEYGLGGRWQFPMDNLTVGQVLDFFAEHKRPAPSWRKDAGVLLPLLEVKWHNETGGPSAYVVIDDYDVAEAFRARFKIGWLAPEEEQDRSDEDALRASGWRP
jgi:hypothetical protein